MLHRMLLGMVLVSSLAACTTKASVESLQATLDRQLASNEQRYGIAGQAVLILQDGNVIYRGSRGLANMQTKQPALTDDVFPVFSVSKLFASVLVMQLVETGDLDLEAAADHYLPDLPARWHGIKVKEFLDHVSGVPEYFDANRTSIVLPATRDAAFAALQDQPLLFTSGTQTRYTQTNFLVIEALLEAHYQTPYRRLVTDRIVNPLGLKHTYLGRSDAANVSPVQAYIGKDHELRIEEAIDWPEYSIVHAELYTTLDDLGSFLKAVCAGRLVKRETLLRLWQPYRYPNGDAGWFAAGWEYGTSAEYHYVSHDGGAKVRVRLLFQESLAQDTYAFIYLTNGSAENVWTRTLIDSVTDSAISWSNRCKTRPERECRR